MNGVRVYVDKKLVAVESVECTEDLTGRTYRITCRDIKRPPIEEDVKVKITLHPKMHEHMVNMRCIPFDTERLRGTQTGRFSGKLPNLSIPETTRKAIEDMGLDPFVREKLEGRVRERVARLKQKWEKERSK